MKARFRILPLLLLCFALLVSGCSMLEKQKLPYQPQSDVAIWMNSLAGLSGEEQGRRADAMRKSAGASLALRDKALSVAASRPGPQGFSARTDLNRLYAAASPIQRGAWEALYWNDLDGMDSEALRSLASKVSPKQEAQFPWNLVMLKAARRGVAPDNAAALSRLSSAKLYAAPEVLGLTVAAPAADAPVYAALVLPQSGPAGTLGRQIAAGAMAAADKLQTKGRKADIRIIDTALPDWQEQLKALPAEFAMIGGPLLPSQVAAVKQAAAGRAVFAFTNSLPAGEEGVNAWRFFASPQDQVRALLDGAESIGITSFGVFTPGDSYGKRMSAAFEQEARARGFSVTAAAYSGTDMSAWTKEASAFLKTEVGEQRGSIPVATADFKGIFLTDSWKNMDMLVSILHYGGAHSKLMLGTSLWEQSLGASSRSNAATFALTVFPASWDPSASSADAFKAAMLARGAKADDWSVLGYDFVQTAAALNLQPGWVPALLNEWLASAPAVEWAGAPLHWNESGLASRRLFLLRPAAAGTAPADLDAMKERILSREADAQMVLEAQAEEEAKKKPASLDQLVNTITKN
ncbi:penicillin-binding protein activator [Mailhella sp.]|uniref:penicillin-binding protein activator n=1 Tax=Mailhella sp. TaxID=1981029 RepID=UPI004062D96A